MHRQNPKRSHQNALSLLLPRALAPTRKPKVGLFHVTC
jgi:hypothetical protein